MLRIQLITIHELRPQTPSDATDEVMRCEMLLANRTFTNYQRKVYIDE